MLRRIISKLKQLFPEVKAAIVSPLPADKNGIRPSIDLETAFSIFSLFFYMNPILNNVLGRASATKIIQPTYILIYFINMYFIYKNRDRFISVLRQGGLIWLIVFLPLISALWSPYPVITLRRAFAVVNTSLFGVYLASKFSLKQVLYLLRYVFVVIVVLSLILAVVFPTWGLMQEVHQGAFRGVFAHKNSAAVRLSIGAIVFLVLSFQREGSRLFNGFFFLTCFGMVTASQSTTGLGACLLSLGALPFLFIPRGKVSQILPGLFGLLLMGFVALLFLNENSGAVLEAFGEDSELTGRSNFWPVIIESIFERFWLGYGYQGYWAGGYEGPSAILGQLATTNTKAHAHNGILETMLSVGFFGLTCTLVNLWSSFLNFLNIVRRTKGVISLFPILFMIQFLAANMVETSLYSFNNFTWVVYIYLVTVGATYRMR